MKNLKLRLKLALSFSCILVMMLVLGFLSIKSVNTISDLGDNYVNITIPAVEANLDVSHAVTAMQKYLLDAILTDDADEFQKLSKYLEDEVTKMDTALDKFLALAPRFEPQITEIRELLANESTYRTEIMGMAANLTGSSELSAYTIYSDTYDPMMIQVEEKLAELFSGVASAVEARQASAHQTKNVSILTNLIVLALALLCTIIAVIILTKAIIRPVTEIQTAMKHMDEGDFDNAQITYVSKDEFGDLSNSIRNTIERISFIVSDLGVGLDSVAAGDFTAENQNTDEYVGVYAPLAASLDKITKDLNHTLGQINKASDQVASGSDQVAYGAQALAQGATEQASSVEELFATVNTVANQVKENAQNAQNAREESEKSSIEVENGNKHMQEMIAAMDEINGKSAEISKIIKTIEDIAFQTNILALNAAVEAARAGTVGKGFAVVADEVRNLAGKSAEAAKNTTTLIEETVLAVESGTRIVGSTAKIMTNVVEGTEKVTTLVSSIAHASNEQASSIAQITQGIEQISSVVQNNSATAEESAAASEELSSQANLLKELISSFHLKEDKPKKSVVIEKANSTNVTKSTSSVSIPYNNDKY